MLRGIERAFYLWLGEAQYRLAVPLTITGRRRRMPKRRRQRDWLELRLASPGYVFRPYLTHHAITVPVYFAGVLWDAIGHIDLRVPETIPGGVVCKYCPPEDRKLYESSEALWREHMFEPFLRWINLELATAKALAILGAKGDVTWVELVNDELSSKTSARLVKLFALQHAPVRTNGAVLKSLTGDASEDLGIPLAVLASWIQRIPDREARLSAHRNLSRRTRLSIPVGEHWRGDAGGQQAWLAERFDDGLR